MSEPRPWGCARCRAKPSDVVDTSDDEEGYRLRVRRCKRCGTRWATEETPISLEAFYLRSATRRRRDLERQHRRKMTCRVCDGTYHYGSYAEHRHTRRHTEALGRRRT